MKHRFEEFLALHQQSEPLLIGNVWDVPSAIVFEKQGFAALGTSSASVAETLGYADGEAMSFDEYLFVVKHIADHSKLPLSVDLESGYADTPEGIAANLQRLHAAGVCGVNLEDSEIVDGNRSIVDAKKFTEKISRVISILNAGNIKMFINLRCDPFILGLPNALEEVLSRIELYQSTQAHGLFVPCITAIEDMRKVCQKSKLPINVMCMPNLPDFNEMKNAGVKRISMGPFLSRNVYKQMESSVERILSDKSFKSLF
ncbi:MAG: isocitrate lyase/phosphoenolpyruvate mutase family protein [Cyclobacteriaceae bacterium]|nr:isocitrate lyase/phosphoenolpyruvate mutase family protein [Cyclobacteriaceae bacterium]